jgi:hypothetical protein
MKWPNLAQVDDILKERDRKVKPLEDRSSDTMSYFTGMILPGPTLPWLLMNSLIDCDDDPRTNALAALTHMHPQSGFQYKSTTYWSSSSIVGKVLAPTCQELASWVGPARPAPDLERIQIARLRQRRPKQHLTINDVESMSVRSDPLGPPSDTYPVDEYQLVLPDTDDIVDTVRIEKLALKPASTSNTGLKDISMVFDACIQFAVGGRSWPLRLSYDVSFICAYPCYNGPHPLFFDYIYKAVKVDEILTIKDWGGLNANTSGSAISSAGARSESKATPDDNEAEKVLVIEAFGVPDNESLARAYCSHWGLSAIIANVDKSWWVGSPLWLNVTDELCSMACAIREAYAACLNVVILVEDHHYDLDV